MIVLSFIQNNSQLKNIAKTCLPLSILIRTLCSSSIVHVQGCSAPQITKQQMSPFALSSQLAVLAMFLAFISPSSQPFFVFKTKTTQHRPQVFSVNAALTCKKAAPLTSSVHQTQNSSKFGHQQLVMVNYACAFSQ